MKTALFPGSFDPLHSGHAEIVTRALGLFDKVVIGIGVNSQKKTLFTAEERKLIAQNTFAAHPQVEVMEYEGLTTEFARKIGAGFLLRGLRSAGDLEFERPVATINREVLGGIETVFLLSSGKNIHISSTIIRELIRYKAPLGDMVPPAVIEMISGRSF